MARLLNLDAARGFALLGIFCVNGPFFAMPLGMIVNPTPPPGIAGLDLGAWWFVQLFCTSKFFPLFSWMFGFGLMLLLAKRSEGGRVPWGVGLRRLFFLMAVGLCHGVFIWSGDILLIYSFMGLILLAACRVGPRTLAIIGACLLGVSALTGALLGAVGFGASSSKEVATAPEYQLLPGVSPFDQFIKGFEPVEVPVDSAVPDGQKKTISPMEQGPESPLWLAAETAAFRDGPFSEATKFRAVNVGIFLIITALNIGWLILGMFMLGAAAAKAGWLTERYASQRRRYAFVILPITLIAGVALNVLNATMGSSTTLILLSSVVPLLSAASAVGYLCLIEQVIRVVPAIGTALASTGRMAFTNYLTQSVVMTGITYHWGLAKFGTLGHAQLLGLVVVIFALQVVFSTLWLKLFSMGPLEYVWRSVTYLGNPVKGTERAQIAESQS
jgi:uncharacterized protein